MFRKPIGSASNNEDAGLVSSHKQGPLSPLVVNRRPFGNSVENSANRVEKQKHPSPPDDKSKATAIRFNETFTSSGQPGLKFMDDALFKFVSESPPRRFPRSSSLLWTTQPVDVTVNDWDFEVGSVPDFEQELDLANSNDDEYLPPVDQSYDYLPPVDQSLIYCDYDAIVEDDCLQPVNQSLLCDNDSDAELSQK